MTTFGDTNIVRDSTFRKVREAYFFFYGLNTDIAQKGGGVQPLPKCFWSTFYRSLYLGKCQKVGGVKAMPKDLEHFKWFNIVEFH